MCDYTSEESRGNLMENHWDVSNRISPMRGFNMPVGENPRITVVRPLGGKSRKGEKLIDEDTYKWDGSKYVYDWEPLKKQINNVQERAVLHQLLIDNPPWAFLRGIDLKGENEVETYGNAWPPNDSKAWAEYIEAMLRELVKTYGRETVEQWRYCIGREIGTKGHWRGTMLEFFEHYRITERAIHAVLPNAKVGTHFLWASSRHSFGPDFVKWAKENNVRYDFIGVSFYPFYDKKERVDLNHVYEIDFAPIKDIPEWNPSARLEIHEFALITKMSAAGNSFDNAPTDHQNAFAVNMAAMMYRHDMVDVFAWGTREENLAKQTLVELEGNRYYQNSRDGEAPESGNMVDAVFAHDEKLGQYNIMVASYHIDPDNKTAEPISIKTTLPAPAGTSMKYRIATPGAGALEWSEWKSEKTTAEGNPSTSGLDLSTKLRPFSFQKIQIAYEGTPPPSSRTTTRVLTQKSTGRKAEFLLIDLKGDTLICSREGTRLEIPISSLIDEDVKFIKDWINP